MKFLSGIAGAQYMPASALSLKPYKSGETNAENFYGIINGREGNPNGFPKCQSCIVHVSGDILNDIQNGYFPGGVHVCFYQQSNFDWLVAFKAENILAARYIRMRNEDVAKLIAQGLDKEAS